MRRLSIVSFLYGIWVTVLVVFFVWQPSPNRPTFEGLSCPKGAWGDCEYKISSPKTMTINFVDPKRFDTTSGNSTGAHPLYSTAGYAMIYDSPCSINIPTGELVRLVPALGRVAVDYDFSDTLIHEILHCYLGDWHPPTSEEFFNRGMYWRDPFFAPYHHNDFLYKYLQLKRSEEKSLRFVR